MEKVTEHKRTSCTADSNELSGCEHSCERNAYANNAEETTVEKYCRVCDFSSMHKTRFLVEKEVLVVSQTGVSDAC